MRIDDCSEFRGHKLKNCSRCGHQFDGLKLTRLNCDQLNAIKDKEWQFGFIWKLSDWAVGEVVKVDVCPKCYSDIISLISAHEQIDKLNKLPVYVDGEYQGEVYAEPYRVDMVDAASYALNFKNGIHINLEERKMKNVNETKNHQNHAFAIERNYDETDRKLFRLEDAETGDFIRLATDEERLIYMVVNIAPVKNRVKVNEKSGSNCVWCVCIQTQDLVELPLSEMVYVYDPRYIAFRIGRFIDS